MKMKDTPKDRRISVEEDGLVAGLRGLRQVEPPPSLVPAVMRRVAEPPPPGFWAWLRRPRRLELRFRATPLGFGAFATALGVAVFWVVQAASPRGAVVQVVVPEAPAANSTDGTVLVRFVLVAKGARRVAVAGDFNGWDADGTVLDHADGQGTFVATVRLPQGAHEYMFVVDGEWITDPAAAERRPDGFGRTNAVLRL